MRVESACVKKRKGASRKGAYFGVHFGSRQREQKLSLTPEGEKAAQLIADANQNFYKVAFRRFEDNEKRVLQALLQLMLNNLDEEGE